MPKKILKGKVISDKNEKTVVVLVERKYQHPFLKKIVSGNEQGATHIADGYARATGNPGRANRRRCNQSP